MAGTAPSPSRPRSARTRPGSPAPSPTSLRRTSPASAGSDGVCLLVTPARGPRVRWITVLTDAPLAPTRGAVGAPVRRLPGLRRRLPGRGLHGPALRSRRAPGGALRRRRVRPALPGSGRRRGARRLRPLRRGMPLGKEGVRAIARIDPRPCPRRRSRSSSGCPSGNESAPRGTGGPPISAADLLPPGISPEIVQGMLIPIQPGEGDESRGDALRPGELRDLMPQQCEEAVSCLPFDPGGVPACCEEVDSRGEAGIRQRPDHPLDRVGVGGPVDHHHRTGDRPGLFDKVSRSPEDRRLVPDLPVERSLWGEAQGLRRDRVDGVRSSDQVAVTGELCGGGRF